MTLGQYYLAANTTKKQVIHPSPFGDGAKLAELHTMYKGLALLLSNGNGRGGGDFTLPYDHQLASPPNGMDYSEAIEAGWKPRDLMPPSLFWLMGTWAGDKIVLCGDYGDAGAFLTKQEQAQLAEQLRTDYLKKCKEEGKPVDTERKFDGNLYNYACCFYEDISDEVVRMLGAADEGPLANSPQHWRNVTEARLFNKLEREYTRGRYVKGKVDLTWLDPLTLDMICRDQLQTPGALPAYKAWLSKQKLPPPVKSILRYYKEPDVDYEGLQRALLKLGYYPAAQQSSLLPPANVLDAFMETYKKATTGDRTARNLLEQLLGETAKGKLPPRSRVVDLTPAGT